MSEGGAAWGGVAELLALVRAGDALVDQDDVPCRLLANPLPKHATGDHSGPARLTTRPFWRPQK